MFDIPLTVALIYNFCEVRLNKQSGCLVYTRKDEDLQASAVNVGVS